MLKQRIEDFLGDFALSAWRCKDKQPQGLLPCVVWRFLFQLCINEFLLVLVLVLHGVLKLPKIHFIVQSVTCNKVDVLKIKF